MARSSIVMPLRFGSRTCVEQRAVVMAMVDGDGAADVLAAVAKALADGADLVDLLELAPERTEDVVRAVRARFPSLVIGVAARSRAAAAAAVEAGADLLTTTSDEVPAGHRAGVVCASLDDAERRCASGLPRESVLIDITRSHDPLNQAEALAAAGWAVLTTCENLVGDTPDVTLAATAIAVSAGVRVCRTRQVKRIRRTVDMVASIAGTRPPARALRALA